jgi:hypothetical protein
VSKSAEYQQELDKKEKDEMCLSLVMQLITSARTGKNDLYREVKKEIKRLNLEDPEAKKFFSATLGRIQTTKF